MHQVRVYLTAKLWGLELQMFDAEAQERGLEDAVGAVAAVVTEDPSTVKSRLEAIRVVRGDATRARAEH
jgi:hypothetical protein